MSQHFLREIEMLKKKILAVGAVVEERISQAITAVIKRDAGLAQQVTEGDDEIDEMEVEVEEDCLKILALYQPVAIDLRFVVAVLKMNNDLERMAAALARKVCVADREVDQLNKAMHVRIQEEMRKHPDQVERLMHTLSISRHLERIGDLATNVAEDVIYTAEGEIVRHRTQAYT
jgi:phosphate transport system protein